jgi:hypothetical protein
MFFMDGPGHVYLIPIISKEEKVEEVGLVQLFMPLMMEARENHIPPSAEVSGVRSLSAVLGLMLFSEYE